MNNSFCGEALPLHISAKGLGMRTIKLTLCGMRIYMKKDWKTEM